MLHRELSYAILTCIGVSLFVNLNSGKVSVKQIIEVVHFFTKWIGWNYAQKC